MADCEVLERFRLSRERIQWLVDELQDELERNTARSCPLSPETQVLIALRYYASGSFLKVIADTMGVSKASSSRSLLAVSQCLNNMAAEWIVFSTRNTELNETMADFFKIAHMPRVIGAVDGSLIPIRAPFNDEHMYVCHKGFHAINAMAVCNAQLSFTNFVCRWQGSVHDSAVFNGSVLHAHLEDGGGQNGWLLGDRGYGIQPYLLTPFRPDDVSTAPQRRYQKAHTKTRNTIERAFGLWKSRFRCLDVSGGALQFNPNRCCTMITATAVLHNMCIYDKTPLPDYIEQPPCQPDFVIEVPAHLHNNAGVLVRDSRINNVFT
ncbi:putative nuclease HARBI1 [Montipora capricornis]|uniref:putative nuclease HARBI1 n=1 Tax=Montipora capricornis TaxID=246305 RepID=UPI0035F1E16C